MVVAEVAVASATADIDLENFPKIYCVKCKEKTKNRKTHLETAKNGRLLVRARCKVCDTKKVQITSGGKKKSKKKSEDDD